MSPFAKLLKEFRLSRKLKQKELADLLGYEPSYLSALERSEKGPPRQEFVQKLTQRLGLDGKEQSELAEALRDSCRQVSLPAKSSFEEYEFISRLRPQLGRLNPLQLKLLDIALKLSEGSPEALNSASVGGRRSARTEAPKM